MAQIQGEIIGTCEEVCGDGIVLPDSPHACDDGNKRIDDGCDDNCQVEAGWEVI